MKNEDNGFTLYSSQFTLPLLADAAKKNLAWKAIARKMGPQALRMNLNTLLRHDVFNVAEHSVVGSGKLVGHGVPDRQLIDYVAGQLADPGAISRSRQIPYQFLAAYMNASREV